MRDRLAHRDQGFGFFLLAIEPKREYRRIQGTPAEKQSPTVSRYVFQTSQSGRTRQLANGAFPRHGTLYNAHDFTVSRHYIEEFGSIWRISRVQTDLIQL